MTGKPYAAFATGGRGGETALAVLDRLCDSFKLKKAVDSVSIAGAPSLEILMACKRGRKETGDCRHKVLTQVDPDVLLKW